MLEKPVPFLLFAGLMMVVAYTLLVYVFDYQDTFSITWAILYFLLGLMMGGIIRFMDARK
ncbi:hypothetical protein ACE1TH_15630 [Shouchella sp. JSM 1781072]|uniref:hypothetical protein n=1 Tax=Bacillaceae TaxID=186817 RepID=UPI000C078D19|nr:MULTISPECIES: hypothetical protein [Bacillaceae]UTR06032.1 hypothetical protein MM326_18440 [Alkalihalobacillus sp. LMS6]